MERRSQRRVMGIHLTAVTKGEREATEPADVGGGIGIVEMSWRERESRIEIEEPEAKAKRLEGLKSADPKLLRLGGPGSMKLQSQESAGGGLEDDIVVC